MIGLLIKNEVYWHSDWSSRIGRLLDIKDSTTGMFVFEPALSRERILENLKDIPEKMYSLVELEEVPESDCEFMTDSGLCYRRVLH